MDRRDFIRVSSILTAGSTVLTSCGKDLRNTLPLMVKDNQMVIGEERRVKSVCLGCGAGCGVEVRWIDGRAVKLEGLADHPVNQGRLCARGQAELQALYNPDRIQGPRQGRQDIPWDQALKLLGEKLKSTDPKGIALVTGRLTGARAKVADDFLVRLGAPPRVVAEPLSESSLGVYAVSAPDFQNCEYVLSFGAPLIEGGPSPVRTQRGLGHMRQGRPGRRGKLVQIESRYSLTAAYADEWVYITPGTEGALAMAIAQVLGRKSEFTMDRFASITGVPAARIERLAREFAAHKPGIAIIGGAAAGHSNSRAAAQAVSALNALAGGIELESPAAEPKIRTIADIAGKADLQKVVLVSGANPHYEFPGAIVPGAFVVSFSPFPDETAEAAQLALPSPTTLEGWQATEYAVAKPAVDPLYKTRDWADVLLSLSGSDTDWAKTAQASDPGEKTAKRSAYKFQAAAEKWDSPRFIGSAEFYLQVYSGIALGTGDGANIPWLQELPEPTSQAVWTTAAEIHPKTAARLGIADGNDIWIESPLGRVKCRAALSPATPPQVGAVPAGQGHTALGRYAKNRGANVFSVIDPALWAATRVKVTKA